MVLYSLGGRIKVTTLKNMTPFFKINYSNFLEECYHQESKTF
jgi:hypothetical protein